MVNSALYNYTMPSENIVVIDNGACSMKIAQQHDDDDVRVLPNTIFRSKSERRKNFISSQINSCKDCSSLFYLLPFQKGYLLNWDVQRQIWDYVFGKDVLNLKCPDTNIVITEPQFNFSAIQETMNEIFFEEYEFSSILRTNASTLSCYEYSSAYPSEDCCLVVDTGYSFTHIVPYYKGKKVSNAVCRIDVGGKLLTNHLKEVISYRQLQVMDETFVMNQAKEDSCFVTMDFSADMEVCRKKGKENTIIRDYVLPDYTHIKRGYLKSADVDNTKKAKSQEQMIRLTLERFTVPEILFHPSDVGIPQMGLAEAVLNSIMQCPEELRPHFMNNIVLTGGNCLFPNFKQRLERDVRSIAPDIWNVFITQPKNPLTYACDGGVTMANSPAFHQHRLTKEEYHEEGQAACAKRFNDI